MDVRVISSFLEMTSVKLESTWQMETLSNISGLRVPDLITGKQDTILRADVNSLWTQWFLESICDPERFTDREPGYGHIFHAVNLEMPSLFPSFEPNQHGELVKQISRLVYREIERRRNNKRVSFSTNTKNILLDIYGPEPRCWICGYKFSPWAIDKFLGQNTSEVPPLKEFIDYLKPHGLSNRDFQIEVDHLFPFSRGGDDDLDNLRLACGWCNSHKSNHLSIYDVAAQPPVLKHPTLGRVSVPHPFWAVRLMGLHRQCSHEGGCDKTVDNSELTVSSRHVHGAMNPMNLRVTCIEHDNLGSDRYVSKSLAERLFKKNS
jgi:hypothetical protein